MKRFMSCAAIALAIATSGLAQAATFTPADCTPGNIHFCVNGDGQAPDVDNFITASITNTFKKRQSIDDTYLFRIDKNGLGSGGLQTSFSSLNTFLSITDLIINGVSYASAIETTSSGSSVSVSGFPIFSGALNSVRVIGKFTPPNNRGQANYTGNLTFTASVPEASTWSMMLLGVGGIGFAMRRRGRSPLKAAGVA